MKSLFVSLVVTGILTGSASAFAAPLQCEARNQQLRSNSRLFQSVDQATHTADFGARDLRKSSVITKLTVQKKCLNNSDTLERLTLSYSVKARPQQGTFEETFFCHTQAQRTLRRNNIWSDWTIAQTICREQSSHSSSPGGGDSGESSGSDSGSPDEVIDSPGRADGSGGPDDVDDGSGSRGNTGEGSGQPGGSDSDF